eukprot:GHVS01033771.1.p3 GENE.GHVS01033771.1~~GHVS01033771.1.p3  ORF type:complete len:111 (-),score=17.45 GHVS01033771.1:82-414(-)
MGVVVVKHICSEVAVLMLCHHVGVFLFCVYVCVLCQQGIQPLPCCCVCLQVHRYVYLMPTHTDTQTRSVYVHHIYMSTNTEQLMSLQICRIAAALCLVLLFYKINTTDSR